MLGPTDDPSCNCRPPVEEMIKPYLYIPANISRDHASSMLKQLLAVCAAKIPTPRTMQPLLTLSTLTCLQNWTHLTSVMKKNKITLPVELQSRILINKSVFNNILKQIDEIQDKISDGLEITAGEILSQLWHGLDQQTSAEQFNHILYIVVDQYPPCSKQDNHTLDHYQQALITGKHLRRTLEKIPFVPQGTKALFAQKQTNLPCKLEAKKYQLQKEEDVRNLEIFEASDAFWIGY